jgi:hypothetical protein
MPDQNPNLKSKFTLPKEVSDAISNSALEQDKAQRIFLPGEPRRITNPTVRPPLLPNGTTLNTNNKKWKGKSGSLNPIAAITDSVGFNPESTIDTLQSINDGLITIVDILETALNIINTIQTDYLNFYKALQFTIRQLLEQLQQLLVSISSTGIYILPVVPDISPLDSNYPPGGGFDAFRNKVNKSLFNRDDPNRPIFNSPGDIVGGVVIALVGGSNLGTLIKDLRVLSRFVSGLFDSDKVNPPKSLQATPGIYKLRESGITRNNLDPEDSVSFFRDLAVGPQALGIKLSWDEPDGIVNAQWYKVFRSRSSKGDPVYDENGEHARNPEASDGSGGELLYEYRDMSFNGGQPVIINSEGDSSLEFIDFDVIEGETYYYKVLLCFEDEDTFVRGENPEEFVDSSLFSTTVSATAAGCLPDSPFKDLLETPEGIVDGQASGTPPYWSNVTLRQVLGPELDQAFKALVGAVERLWGLVQTSSDHFNTFLDSVKDTLLTTRELLTLIQRVVQSLKDLQLSGSALSLWIDPEEGGMPGFASRFNNADVPEDLQDVIYPNGDPTICEIYGGFVALCGVPGPSSFKEAFDLTDQQVENITPSKAFDNSRTQFEQLDERGKEAKEAILNVLELIGGLFGGGDS